MNDALPALLHGFFHHWLVEQRNASRHTILAYRDAWRLFLRFTADRTGRPVAKLRLDDLTAGEVIAFLQHIETGRGVSIATRNCRLAAVRSFFLFVADREPSAAAQCADVLRIPSKKKAKRAICYLEQEEVAAILAQPDQTTLLGQRDHVLLGFLYNTGARIQEALDVCPKHLHLGSPAHVRLFGKGRKERLCPLWPETANLILALLHRWPEVRTSQYSAIDMEANSARPEFAFNCGNTLNPPEHTSRAYLRSGSRRIPSATRPLSISSLPASM
jgi:site-specific recombinase XerD